MHVYVVYECSNENIRPYGFIHGVYKTRQGAEKRASRIDIFAYVAVLKMRVKGE